LTVNPKSVDRVIRYRAGSTCLHPAADQNSITQSENGGPCCAGPTRWRGRRGCASATESRARVHDAGCSAEMSACPWPRLFLLSYCRVGVLHRHDVVLPVGTQAPSVRTSVSLASPGAVPETPGSQPCRHVRATVRGY
jgi:hypothetical protein